MPGTKQSFFFSAPQRDANRTPRLYSQRFQNARGLHHDRTTNGVVRRTRGGVPGIKVPAEHDHFVLLVCTGNLRDGVV